MNPKHEVSLVEIKPGDFISIPMFNKHHVDWTTPDEPTVWLIVRYGGGGRADL
jgi:cupin 2 domain-containing protein